MDWRDIEGRLVARSREVCEHLFPKGKVFGGEFCVGNIDGREGESLKINLATGKFADFAGDVTGKSFTELWMRAKNFGKFGMAVGEAKRWLGITDSGQRIHRAPDAGEKRKAESGNGESVGLTVASTWPSCQPLTEGGPVWQFLVDVRKLDPGVLALFDVREYLTRGEWAMVFPYFAVPDAEELVLPKKAGEAVATVPPAWLKFEAVKRVDGKKREWTTKAPEKSLFGIQLAESKIWPASRHVLLCEGEKDVIAWASMGCGAWGLLPLSVPFGAKWKGQDKNRPSPNREWLDRSWDWLQDYETIFIAMDGDEAGNKAAADIIGEIGPRRCRLVSLPHKDANECLQKGISPAQMRECIDGARDFAPDKIVSAVDLEEDFLKWVFERDEEAGVRMPFEFPLRFRRGEETLWLGIEKSGKTTLLNFATIAAMAQGERCLIASFEVPWPDTHDKLCRQALGKLYFDRKKIKKAATADEHGYLMEEARAQTVAAHRWVAKSLWYYQHVGIGNWRQLMDDIRWARRRLGVTWVIIDNFMRLGIPKDDYAQQAEAIIALTAVCMELQIHLHIVLHKNKNDGQKGGADGKRSASGAHELLGNPHNIVEVQRDDKKGKQVAEMWEERKLGTLTDMQFAEQKASLDLKPDGKFLLHAQRNGQHQDGSKHLWFLWESQQYVSVPPGHKEHAPLLFVESAAAEENKISEEDFPL